MITIIPELYQLNHGDIYNAQHFCPICDEIVRVRWDTREHTVTPKAVCSHFQECQLVLFLKGQRPVFVFSII